MSQLRDFFGDAFFAISNMGFSDILDILIVALLIYSMINMVRSTSTARVAKGIIFLLLITWITGVAHLYVLNYLLSAILELGFIALVIMFQPELRRALEKLGGKNVWDVLNMVFGADKNKPVTDIEKSILATVSACEIMSKERVGVLLVFERQTSLEDYFKTGTRIDADTSEQLLRNLFFPKASLHDGAVIVRGGRIAAAGCVMPLSENPNLNSDLGTRHRAGIGTSELTDAVVVIVSEETGTISVAVGGMLKRHLAPQTLERLLRNELVPAEPEQKPLLARLREQLTMRKQKDA